MADKFEIPRRSNSESTFWTGIRAGRSETGATVFFHHASIPNEAGWFATWRADVQYRANGTVMSEVGAWPTRKEAISWARRSADAFIEGQLVEDQLAHRVRVTRSVLANDLKRWMRGRPGRWAVHRDSGGRLYAFENAHIAFEFKNAFG